MQLTQQIEVLSARASAEDEKLGEALARAESRESELKELSLRAEEAEALARQAAAAARELEANLEAEAAKKSLSSTLLSASSEAHEPPPLSSRQRTALTIEVSHAPGSVHHQTMSPGMYENG